MASNVFFVAPPDINKCRMKPVKNVTGADWTRILIRLGKNIRNLVRKSCPKSCSQILSDWIKYHQIIL